MIRDVTVNDKSVFLEMAEIFYSSPAVTDIIGAEMLVMTFDAAIGKSPFVRVLIIEDDGATVGFAILSFSHATEVGGSVVLLEDLYISDSCRGKGLGSTFMQFVEREYPSAKRFRLEVTKDNNRAIDLYSRLGYKTLDYVQMVKDA
jgi:ribosomal protein S18 acetylase RimI-like enzyme